MKPAEKMERLVKRFCDAKKSSVKTSAQMDGRTLAEAFEAYDKSRTEESAASQPGIWRIIMKSRTVKLAAAAVIIAAALIGIKVLVGSGEPPAIVPLPQPAVSGAVDENSDSPVDIELKQVRQMYAAGDVKGLAAMLAEGHFESKVLAADYLAQMEGGVEALEALENVQAQYGKDEAGNPFTPAVQRLRNRAQAASGQGSPPSVMARGQPLVALEPDQPQAVVVVEGKETQTESDSVVVMEEPKDTSARFQNEKSDSSGELKEDVDPDSSSAEGTEDAPTGPELVEGISGYACYFDGAGDYIDIGDDPSIQTEVFTVAAWIATSDQQIGWQTIVSYERGSHAVSVVRGRVHYGWQWIKGGLAGTSDVRTGQWEFVALTRDPNYRASIYVNGELESSFVDGTTSAFSRRAKIGGDVYDGEYFHGSIDEVAIFNRPLSAEEIQRLYQNPGSLRGNEAGLVGYWSFDNDEGELIKDASPYGNHGTPGHESGYGAPVSPPDVVLTEPAEPRPAPDGECAPELTEGASGYGYYFDGDGDYIEIPPIEGLGAEHTKMLWANPDTSPRPNYVYLIDQDQRKCVGNNNWIELVRTNGDGSKIRTGYDGGNFFDSDSRIQLGQWNHVAVVSTSDGDVYNYINGVFDSSHSGFSVANEPAGILIGATSSNKRSRSENFKGIIDEVAFFNRALSDDEIWQIYQNAGRLRGNEAGLVGYWNFDRDDGDTVRDISRYGNNGTLGSAAPPATGDSAPVTDGEVVD